jgi:FAD/FMN-containing dehydrogenase
VFGAGVRAELVVRPRTVEEVQKAVALCTARGRAVIPRGGGWSYTAGYLPVRERSVVVDLSRLTRIVEVNPTDMYATVEAGVTWRQLYDALADRGLRTPYFGPMSGYASTVGGALSQGGVFLGSTQYGTTAETVLGLDVVLADGTLLRTGSGASREPSSPFFRTYGPDLTGPFLNDTGALGFKVRTTLRLIQRPEHTRFASFGFDGPGPQLHALAEISRRGLAAECFGSDPFVSNLRFYDSDLSQDLSYLKGVVNSGPSLLKGIKDAARMAMAGRKGAGAGQYLLNVVIDDRTGPGADATLEQVREIGRAAGRELEASAPRALRAQPFVYPNSVLGMRGERFVPTNSLAPHSRAPEVMAALEHFLESRAAQLDMHGISWGYVVLALSTSTTLIEPLFYWPDARSAYHARAVEPEYLRRLPAVPPSPEATEAVGELRRGLTALFRSLGCVHLQIGKAYPYRETRDPATYALLEAIKNHVDPARRINPGSLGLD